MQQTKIRKFNKIQNQINKNCFSFFNSIFERLRLGSVLREVGRTSRLDTIEVRDQHWISEHFRERRIDDRSHQHFVGISVDHTLFSVV